MLPAGYLQSRRRFLELATAAGASCISLPYAQLSDSDVALTTDVAYLGDGDAPTLIVIASGTHGVEGYAGAACQFHFLQNFNHATAPDDIAFLLVHAVNPWGFYHDRRVTHEGIDLNRNFVEDFSPANISDAYTGLHRRLVTDFKPLPAGWWNEVRLLSGALSKKSRNAIQVAITGGQRRHPDGLFYGGIAPAHSRLVWEEILKRYTAERASVALLDIHTGLGKQGSHEIISYLPESSAEFLEMSSWFNGGLKSMQGGASVTTPVEGSLTEGFDRLVPCQSYAIGLEFGTRAPLAVLNAMRFDQWYHNHAASLPEKYRAQARQKMRRAFRIESPAWYDQITSQFSEVMRQVIAGMAKQTV